MTRSDDKKIAALVKKNLAKANPAPKGGTKRRQYDPTLQPDVEDDPERSRFFKDMKKREF